MSIELHVESILPPESSKPVPLWAYAVYLEDGRQRLANSTLPQVLSAVAEWHSSKSGGELLSSSNHPFVRAMLEGAKRLNRGTGRERVSPAVACPVEWIAALVDCARSAAAIHRQRGEAKQAHLCSREAAFMAVTFAAALRAKSEALHLQWGDLTDRGSHMAIEIRRSKTDQLWAGASVLVAKTSRHLQLEAVITELWNAQTVLGWSTSADAPLFRDGVSGERLQDVQSLLRRIHALHLPEANSRGYNLPPRAFLSGHSFRRGGINAARDAGRAAGWNDAAILALLLKIGRWASPESAQEYLVENEEALRELATMI
jgi:integrase